MTVTTRIAIRTLPRAILAGTLAALVAAAPGCAAAGFFAKTFHEAGSTKVFAEYEGLKGEDFAVLVHADQVLRAQDTSLVSVVTNGVTRTLSQPDIGATGVVPGPAVLMFQYENPSWPSWSYSRLADEFTVSRLVVIDLYEYRLNEPGNRHVWDGRAAARVSVFEAELGGEEFAFSKDIVVQFPDGTGFTRNELLQEVVEANLQDRLIKRISWLMYDHEEPNNLEF